MASSERLKNFCVADCIADCVWLAVPESTKWQRIGNQIDAAPVLPWSNFVRVNLAVIRPSEGRPQALAPEFLTQLAPSDPLLQDIGSEALE
jgi:hypothetical protein